MLFCSAENLVRKATQEGHYCASPVWSLVVRGFLRWRTDASQEKRNRLLHDLQMMVVLLHQTSGTIEELRVRLVTSRIYGIIRRQVFVAWHKSVEHKFALQIASATLAVNADDLSRGSRTPSLAGDHSSRPRTHSEQYSRPSSRPNSSRMHLPPSVGSPQMQMLALGSDGGGTPTSNHPRRGGGIPSAPTSARSREALVRQLQQARESLAQPRRTAD